MLHRLVRLNTRRRPTCCRLFSSVLRIRIRWFWTRHRMKSEHPVVSDIKFLQNSYQVGLTFSINKYIINSVRYDFFWVLFGSGSWFPYPYPYHVFAHGSGPDSVILNPEPHLCFLWRIFKISSSISHYSYLKCDDMVFYILIVSTNYRET